MYGGSGKSAAANSKSQRVLFENADDLPRKWFMLSEPQSQPAALSEMDRPESSVGDRNGKRWMARLVISVLLVGTAVGWYIVSGSAQGDAPWGFARAELVDQAVGAEQYWRNLASGCDDWEQQQPADRAMLRRQFVEFRAHFQKLFALPHQPLNPTDRAWLDAKLIEWDEGFDRHATDIETLVLPFDHVRRQLAMTMRKIGNQLRFRANQATESTAIDTAAEQVSPE